MRGSHKVTTPTPGVKLTYKDFMRFPDDGLRHELIDGEHYVTPAPNTKHQTILGNLHLLIGNWLETHPVGRVFFAPFDVVFSNFDVVEPDLLYLSHARAAEALTPKHLRGVPELVVEIASKGTRKRDETIKRRLYERTGVTEYWVIDPDLERIRVDRQGMDGFTQTSELSRESGDLLTTPLLPQLEMPLVRIFRA
jgi:Uma2 family endonuclease